MSTVLILLTVWLSLGVALATLVAAICQKVSGPTVDDSVEPGWSTHVPAPRASSEQAVRVS